MKSYPISLKITVVALVMLLTMVVVFAATPTQKKIVTNLTPDSKLPWGGTVDEVEVVLNALYKEAAGMPLQLCGSQLENVYAMCIIDSKGNAQGSHMVFHFEDGGLIGYRAKYEESDLEDIMTSVKHHYNGGGRGSVSSRTRTISIYEHGNKKKKEWKELYIVQDKRRMKNKIQG